MIPDIDGYRVAAAESCR